MYLFFFLPFFFYRIESGFNKVVFVDTITVVHYKQVNGKYQDVTEPYAKKHLCCDDGYLAIFEKRQNEYRIFQVILNTESGPLLVATPCYVMHERKKS